MRHASRSRRDEGKTYDRAGLYGLVEQSEDAPVGDSNLVLADALEEDGFRTLGQDLRRVVLAWRSLSEQLRRAPDMATRMHLNARSGALAKKHRAILRLAGEAVWSALGHRYSWWADRSGVASGHRSRSVASHPVDVIRRSSGGFFGSRFEKPSVLVRIIGPAGPRMNREYLAKPEDVTEQPATRVAPGTTAFLRR